MSAQTSSKGSRYSCVVSVSMCVCVYALYVRARGRPSPRLRTRPCMPVSLCLCVCVSSSVNVALAEPHRGLAHGDDRMHSEKIGRHHRTEPKEGRDVAGRTMRREYAGGAVDTHTHTPATAAELTWYYVHWQCPRRGEHLASGSEWTAAPGAAPDGGNVTCLRQTACAHACVRRARAALNKIRCLRTACIAASVTPTSPTPTSHATAVRGTASPKCTIARCQDARPVLRANRTLNAIACNIAAPNTSVTAAAANSRGPIIWKRTNEGCTESPLRTCPPLLALSLPIRPCPLPRAASLPLRPRPPPLAPSLARAVVPRRRRTRSPHSALMLTTGPVRPTLTTVRVISPCGVYSRLL